MLWEVYPLTKAIYEPESHLTNALGILEEYCAGQRPRPKRSDNMVMCNLGVEEHEVQHARIDCNAIRAYAVKI